MNILVFNCGSSSLTYKIFEVSPDGNIDILVSGKAHRVGVTGSKSSFIEHHYRGDSTKQELPIPDHKTAANLIFDFVEEHAIPIDNIGHRFVHGGNYFPKTAPVNEENLKKLDLCLPLAPIHNPVMREVVGEALKFFPNVPEYVTFDSAFHSSLPHYAYTYALPKDVMEKLGGFRKYGFHGLSYQYVTEAMARFLNTPKEKLKIVACHLGTGGSSVCAIKNGLSVDTSMGDTPLAGLIMSTRCGDIDPIMITHLMDSYGFKPGELENILNKKSGLLGVAGFSSDIRDIDECSLSAQNAKEQAALAFNMYVHHLKKYIGSYIAALRGIDALVFTDDVGVQSWHLREKVCKDMEWCGIELNGELNSRNDPGTPSILNDSSSRVKIISMPTAEELVICQEGLKLLKEVIAA